MAGINSPYRYLYKHCPASTTTVLGNVGATGDYLDRLVITVNTAATAQVQLKDGASFTHTIFPNSPGGGIGCYTIHIGAASKNGAWSVVTGAGCEVLGVGIFSA